MIVSRLDAVPGIGPTTAKAIVVIVLGGVALVLTDLAVQGYATGIWSVVLPGLSFIVTGLSALLNTSSTTPAGQ